MLVIDKAQGGGYRISGTIDDSADLTAFPNAALDIDLSGVERINSMGLLAWQRWRRAHAHAVTLRNVPVPLVLAMSWIAGLAEGMRIASVRAPFVDDETGETEELVLDAALLRKIRGGGECPRISSPTTTRLLRLDEDPKQYFAFLTVPRAPTLEGDAS